MNILTRFKNYLLNRKARSFIDGKERLVSLKEFDDVKTIAVLFDASDENIYKKATHLIRHFESLNKKTHTICLLSRKESDSYIDNTLSIHYIEKAMINWFGFPKSEFVKDFVSTEYDLLIDLNFYHKPSLSFL